MDEIKIPESFINKKKEIDKRKEETDNLDATLPDRYIKLLEKLGICLICTDKGQALFRNAGREMDFVSLDVNECRAVADTFNHISDMAKFG